MTQGGESITPDAVAARTRVLQEYRRREEEVAPSLYAPWNAAEMFFREHRRRIAVGMLHRASVFPGPEDQCLEVGYGRVGWLADLIGWGVPCGSIHGIELDERRAAVAQRLLPGADLRVGDATALPWDSDSFHLVIVSTVFSSILEASVRRRLAEEITRVLAPDGAVLCYDFRINNPRNRAVLRLTRADLTAMFPELNLQHRTVTLAPPIARRVAPLSWSLATFLELFPPLRTHMLTLMIRPPLGP